MADEQKTLVEYEFYQGQAELFKKNLAMLDASLTEIEITKAALDEIKKAGEKNEVLLPVGAGSFVKASILDTKNVILDLGANVAAKKGLDEAKEELDERRKRLERAKEGNLSELQGVLGKLEELTPKVEGIVSKMQEKREEQGVV